MRGWKTWAGAALVGVSGVLRYFGYGEVGELLLVVGGSLGMVGIGHKLEKRDARGKGM